MAVSFVTLALTAQALAATGVGDKTPAYAECLTGHLLGLGAKNNESSETLLKIARPKCVAEYEAVKLQAEGNALAERLLHGTRKDPAELLDKEVEKAEGHAIERLLMARTGVAERG